MSAMAVIATPDVSGFFDQDSNTVSYIIVDGETGKAAIIDSVLDFDYASGSISYHHADAMIAEIKRRNLTLEWLIETHVHADHLSAAPYIQQTARRQHWHFGRDCNGAESLWENIQCRYCV